MPRFFNEDFIDKEAHMAITAGKKVIQLPIVRGVVMIPHDLMQFAALHAKWVPFVGQVSDINDEHLAPIKDVQKHYADKAKAN